MSAIHRVAANDPIAPGRWTAADIPDQSGRTIVVTGANSGLGFQTALELARHGAHVVMTARDETKGRAAKARIEAEHVSGSLELRRLDLADLDDVRRFVATIIEDGLAVDVLVNNAGVMMPPRTLTRQGHELQFGVNHLAHFVLTALLLDRLAQNSDGRVVTVSSDLHKRGQIHFDDLAGARNYGRVSFYAQSKFANVLFALELDRRLKAAGLPVRSLLAHPGYSATNLQLSGPTGILKLFMRFGNHFLAQDVAMGALNQLHAATAPTVSSGQFIGPDGKGEKSGYPTLVQPIAAARDADLARRLWQLSEDLTGVRFDPANRAEPVDGL
ncbi:SDR family NAD(P)-dependent oxidoreductase [Mesorhizobium sp. AR10]|uniref:oxidoreductase n=1 Tax=Mesorhizobium sp. AR10 TaxID=2865839 RepID=UPI002160BD18|nr:oxidoreductase [Mesorhizobium sp. AR10]UVK37577.1 SDR family NAD(P)-dependent oxidoreductase [Mesorhizobium sp. AR10]